MSRRSLANVVVASGLVVGVACAGCAESRRANSASGGAELVLRDSAAYESEVVGGTLARLYVSDTFVDSVDLAFGVYRVGEDSLVFLPVRGLALDDGGRGAEITRHVLATGGKRREFEGWLPYFTSYFSSPVVQARSLYYWGLRPISAEGGRYDLYAMRYTFGVGRLDSLWLERAELYTDNRFHLPSPELTDSGVVFAGDSATYLVSRDFRTAERRPRTSRPAL